MRCEHAEANDAYRPRRVAHWQSAAATRQRRGFDSFRAYQLGLLPRRPVRRKILSFNRNNQLMVEVCKS